ncbi:rhodanese-like domain-containing protein [Nocardioides nitrophenolicus]|uniref:rhodanese-like domain-containing protein n=1 Tax=Nocardioides nitrophenolicus TaxID=60489 RepID=UPI0019573777|nr:rhodanese-like domain-containing protein [Nocardioides nitrophenolicus]MBM7517545.1 rhodanese-related sulfurtransferase [Nocardioides nitrophenolicus]
MTTTTSTSTIDVATLHAWLADGDELAVIDVRDRATVGYASPLFTTNLPADELLDTIDRFVPRRVVRTALIDGGDGTAERLAAQLSERGWTRIVAVEGGIPAWLASGERLPTFDVPGNDFTLAVSQEQGTPVTTVAELTALREAGEDVVVIDTRTLPEFADGHVPGAIGVPGAELLLRFADVVPDPSTRVVVSCAGLARAILGAQTLIDAGVANPVSFLYDGTRAWTDAGGELETGATAVYDAASATALAATSERVAAISADDSFPRIDLATAEDWAADPDRTTYLLDVRTPEEYAADHLLGSLSSEGGQLLGVAYRTIAVRGARVVLIDDLLGARAAVVAHWLQRRGFEIALLLHPFPRPGSK